MPLLLVPGRWSCRTKAAHKRLEFQVAVTLVSEHPLDWAKLCSILIKTSCVVLSVLLSVGVCTPLYRYLSFETCSCRAIQPDASGVRKLIIVVVTYPLGSRDGVIVCVCVCVSCIITVER